MLARCPLEGRRLMRIANIVSLVSLAGVLSGCGWFQSSSPGSSVQFVASNPSSVLLDFAATPPGEMVFANDTATRQCQIFSRRSAVLESLNVRNDGVIRATYLCKNSSDMTEQRSTQFRRQ
jgi:hypothetical protein